MEVRLHTTHGQSVSFCRVLMLLVLGVTAMQAEAAAMATLSMNGQTLSAETGLEFEPGKAHLLRVVPDWARLAEDQVTILVRKCIPDGKEDVLRAEAPRGEGRDFELGPLTAPPSYAFQQGEVLRRGYRLRVELVAQGTVSPLWSISLVQGQQAAPARRVPGVPIPAGVERFLPGDEEWSRFLPHRAVGEAIVLRLSEKVLRDPDALIIQAGLAKGARVQTLPCELRILGPDGLAVYAREVTLAPHAKPTSHPVDPRAWPAGNYIIRLCPIVAGKRWNEGLTLTYRRRAPDPDAVAVSHLAPWTLRRDRTREAWETRDLRKACAEYSGGLPEGSQFEDAEGQSALICPPGMAAEPVELRLPLAGYYALFARATANGCLIQAGENELVRVVPPGEDVFVCATDLTGSVVRVFAFDTFNTPRTGLASLRLVPVTRESVEAFRRETGNPPVPLTGVDDWGEYFHGPVRIAEDQFATIAGGQAELGLRTLAWSVGRSWVEYHSKLPQTTRFPCIPLAEARKLFDRADNYIGRITMQERYDPLECALGLRERFGLRVWGWLAMNRHYGPAYGGMFASRWFRENPQWHDWGKNAKAPLTSVVCYYFPEVRRERVAILKEVAERSPDGLVIGCCRQVPMLLYHPEMVAAFREETGIDPLKIDASNREEYERWIRWRADHFTEVLRLLRRELRALELERGRRIPVAVRVPSVGLFLNLAQGLDIEQWLREGLVDCLQLDPLETCAGEGVHDVRPYLQLGRRYQVRVIGGVGATWSQGGAAHLAGLRRALGLLEAGVDGIEIYETECLARTSHYRWILPLFGNAPRLKAFLAESNLDACFPVTAATAFYGYDNHSRWDPQGWTVHGSGGAVL
ncbi:MAG TPA: hypothetical protein PLU39_16115 [Armatimonadota bacterium]|nr:hypothetical protein [Armatimonadota bacterium]